MGRVWDRWSSGPILWTDSVVLLAAGQVFPLGLGSSGIATSERGR